MKKDIKRAIIEMTVDRGLREINDDPRRSIRKMADYGKQFGKGRFMQAIHGLYQDLLRNDDSPYYSAIELVLKHTDRKALKDFGINIGYNSFTKGGKIIRKSMEQTGLALPWYLYFTLNSDSEKSFSPQELIPIIAQCKKYGIFSFMIELENDLTYLESAISLFRMYDDCAFMLFLPDCELSEQDAVRIKSATNVLNFINAQGENNYANAFLLKQSKVWYGSCGRYDRSSFADIPVSESIKQYIEFESPFVLLIASEETDLSLIRQTADEVKKTRMEPKYPLITFDLFGDGLRIGELISGKSTYIRIGSSGMIHTSKKDIPFSRNAFDLNAVLKEACSDPD